MKCGEESFYYRRNLSYYNACSERSRMMFIVVAANIIIGIIGQPKPSCGTSSIIKLLSLIFQMI